MARIAGVNIRKTNLST